MEIKALKNIVIGRSIEIYNILGYGFLENVYKEALLWELTNLGIKAETEKNLDVEYKGQKVGFYRPYMIVDDQLIIELKSVEFVTKKHSAQLVNYLTATKIDYGLLINFGNPDKLVYFPKTRIYHIDIQLNPLDNLGN